MTPIITGSDRLGMVSVNHAIEKLGNRSKLAYFCLTVSSEEMEKAIRIKDEFVEAGILLSVRIDNALAYSQWRLNLIDTQKIFFSDPNIYNNDVPF